MVDKDLYFSRHSLKPNPSASFLLNDFVKFMTPDSHTEMMAAYVSQSGYPAAARLP